MNEIYCIIGDNNGCQNGSMFWIRLQNYITTYNFSDITDDKDVKSKTLASMGKFILLHNKSVV